MNLSDDIQLIIDDIMMIPDMLGSITARLEIIREATKMDENHG